MKFSTLNSLNKRKLVFISFLLLNFFYTDEILASKKRSIISGVDVKVYQKEKKHIEISALLCALSLNGSSLKEVKKNLEFKFQKPISKSDKFLITDLMRSMCPEIDNKKIFEN